MNTERKTYQKLVNTAQAAAEKKTTTSYAELLRIARSASEKAYAPYSDFQVGAALLAEDGRIFTGCNVEVCTFDGGICAERVAFVKAISEGVSKFKAVAVVCRRSNGSWPCGLCRQFMLEFGVDLDVAVEGPDGQVQTLKLGELMPHHFGPDALKK
jgi:cytidine deaminase